MEIVTTEPPTVVQLDPLHVTWDWDRRNDVRSSRVGTIPAPRIVFDWTGLDQSDRARTIVALSPLAWYSDPQGITLGVRAHTNYLSMVDRHDGALALSVRNPVDVAGRGASVFNRLQFWVRAANIYLPGLERPLMGYSGAAALLDGILKLDVEKHWDLRPFILARGPAIEASVYATTAYASEPLLTPEQWSAAHVTELGGSASYESAPSAGNARSMRGDSRHQRTGSRLCAGRSLDRLNRATRARPDALGAVVRCLRRQRADAAFDLCIVR